MKSVLVADPAPTYAMHNGHDDSQSTGGVGGRGAGESKDADLGGFDVPS